MGMYVRIYTCTPMYVMYALHCIVSMHLYSVSSSAHQSEALPSVNEQYMTNYLPEMNRTNFNKVRGFSSSFTKVRTFRSEGIFTKTDRSNVPSYWDSSPFSVSYIYSL